MSGIIKQSFGVNLIAMRFLGMYPPENCKLLYEVHAYARYFLCIVSVPVLGFLYLFLEEDVEFMQVADTIFLMAKLGCFIPKFWPFVCNGRKIKRCINYFESPMFSVVKDEHVRIISGCVALCRNTTGIMVTAVAAGFFSWAIRPIFWKNHPLPTNVWLPFNPTSGALVQHLVYAYLVIAIGCAAFTSAVVDPLIGGLACQAAYQIKILKDNLEHLSDYADEDIPTSDNSRACDRVALKFEIIYEKIKRCVDHHDAILTFVKEYEECVSQVAFSQFTGGILVVCGSCLQLTLVEPLSFSFMAMLSYLVVMLGEMYVYCYYGTLLYEESNSITGAIYMGKWYEYDLKSRKALLILMERSQRPIVVTAGKILDLSLATFATILRRSYSLLAVLNSYN